MVLIEKFFAVGLLGSDVVGWQDDGLAGESMAQRVEGRALFAGLGSRAGGVLGVRPIYFSASSDIAIGILVC